MSIHAAARMEVITDAAEATPVWLTAILRRNGHLREGEVTTVRELGRESQPHSTVCHLEAGYRGYVRLPNRFFLKLSRQPGVAWGDRELEFYRLVAPAMAESLRADTLPFPRHFDVAYSAETGNGHVLLEDLSPTHAVGDGVLPPSTSHCEEMVDALACMHAFWWEHPRLGSDIGAHLTAETIDSLLTQAKENLAGWLEAMGDRVSPARRATYERVCAAWPPRRVERLVAGRGITLVHRDTHAANFLYPRFAGRDHVRLVDWQSWRVDTGTDDLAYMMAAHWYPERRTRLERLLLERYYGRLREFGVAGYTWEECWYDYLASIIRVLFFLIGGWQPGRAPALWFDRVERATLAYEGLGCAHLLP